MLSDIYGQDKKEKYLIIVNLLKDSNIFGIVYGKKGIGKSYIVEKAVNDVSQEKDKKIFLEADLNWFRNLLAELGTDIPESVSKEEFFIYFVDFVEKFSGRIFIVVNNVQKLSEKQLTEIYHLIGIKDKVSTILIGDENLKRKLSLFKVGKMETSVNFKFEIKPPEFYEFERYFYQKYGDKVEKKAVKKLYSLTEGSIEQAEQIISQIGRFPVKGSDIKLPTDRKKLLKISALFVILLMVSAGYFAFFKKEEKNVIKPEKVIKMDKKLPTEGSVVQDLPVKTKKKKKTDILELVDIIKGEIKNLRLDDIPEISFYRKPIRYIVQIGSFKNKNNAVRLEEKLSKDFTGIKVIEGKNGINSVVIYASDKKEAGKIISKLKKQGLNPILRKVQ